MKPTNKSLKPTLYIIYFIAGTVLFLLMTCGIKVPVYQTVEGTVSISGAEVIIQINDYETETLPEQIYYYVNRDEWVECVSDYDASKAGYVISNIHNLEDKTTVHIDVETEQMTLFEIIFKRGGDI
ncbi:MAG: hypothetical protein E7266_04525 [Lachnospiraceae bacterium]|nr:hypothetical protein [Lachnospiraceae bacterium]